LLIHLLIEVRWEPNEKTIQKHRKTVERFWGETAMAGVLIVDDASFMRNVLKRIVLQAGHEVIAEAGNGDEAIVLYRQHKPDIVLLDIVMPAGAMAKDGIEALKKIMSEDPSATCVMCSSMGQQSLIVEALKSGAKDFVTKPFKPHKVLEVLCKYC
jgi:two-component system chemotaxis response regulator CheY